MLDPSLAIQLNIPGVTNSNSAEIPDNVQKNAVLKNAQEVVDDVIHISTEGGIQERIDFLNLQLDDIFGMSEALSAADLEKEEALWVQIESILGVEEEPTLSKADQRKVDGIFE